MLQKGTLYSPSNNENAVEFKKPIPNVFIYFSQNGTRKYTVKTDAKGAFSVDLALGNYQVTISQGAGFEIFPLGGGAPFELTKDSTVDAFEKWVLSSVYLKPEENPLVILLNSLVLDARTSATNAKTEANRAEQAVGNSVGEGKLMREGAYGVGARSPVLSITDFNDVPLINATYTIAGEAINGPRGSGVYTGTLDVIVRLYNAGPVIATVFRETGKVWERVKYNKDWSNWKEYLTTSNTTVDSNGFIKAASPIVKLFDTHIEANDSFKEEPIFEKISQGVYRISNTLSLAQSGWTYNVPKDGNDKPYFHVIVQKTLDGAIISVHDQFETRKKKKIKDIYGDEQTVEVVEYILSEARDIKPHERWIDLRFHSQEIVPEELEEEISIDGNTE